MTNAELIATIQVEIARLHAEHSSRYETDEAGLVLERLEDFLSDLEKSLPKVTDCEGLEEEIKRYYDDMDGDCRYAQTARNFAQWGAEHASKNVIEDVELDFQVFGKVMSDILAVYKSPSNPEEEPFDYEWTIARHFYELGLNARKKE